MAKIYWKYVKNGTKTFSEVPDNLKEAVKALALEEVETGVIKQDFFDEIFVD